MVCKIHGTYNFKIIVSLGEFTFCIAVSIFIFVFWIVGACVLLSTDKVLERSATLIVQVKVLKNATCFSEILVKIYQTARCHKQEDHVQKF
jgi:hypothetical protein